MKDKEFQVTLSRDEVSSMMKTYIKHENRDEICKVLAYGIEDDYLFACLVKSLMGVKLKSQYNVGDLVWFDAASSWFYGYSKEKSEAKGFSKNGKFPARVTDINIYNQEAVTVEFITITDDDREDLRTTTSKERFLSPRTELIELLSMTNE